MSFNLPTEAIILAGGRGSRLKNLLPSLPKPLAPVNGEPFLSLCIRNLLQKGIQRFVFSLGYEAEQISAFLDKRFPYLQKAIVVEKEPLDTGGGIRLAMESTISEDVLVLNADSLCNFDLSSLARIHGETKADCSLVALSVEDSSRYGALTINTDFTLASFGEKTTQGAGLINAGVYLLKAAAYLADTRPVGFSFEQDYLSAALPRKRLAASVQSAMFIDIGTEESWRQAQDLLKKPALRLKDIDSSWTLFLDRDGVINHDKVGSYIFSPEEFRFYDAVPEAIARMGKKFGRVLVATNQRGVGRGLMSEISLTAIHEKMLDGVKKAGGSIDSIFYCTANFNQHPMRKPLPGMAMEAVRQYPEIDLHRSIMVGNNLSDMQFGRNSGMYTVYLTTTNPPEQLPHPDIDLQYALLTDFAKEM